MLRPRYVTSRISLAIARAAALGALHVHVGQELHVDLDVAVAAARFAAPAFDVEAEMAGRIVVRPGLDRVGKHLANRVEGLDVRHRIGPRRAADRALVDQHHVVDLAVAEDVVERVRLRRVFAFAAAQGAVQRVLHQRALARAADAGHQAQHAQGKLDGQVLQVVAPAPVSRIQPRLVGRRRCEPPTPRRPLRYSPVRLALGCSISCGVP